jgi:Short C-terminal domain
MADTASLIVRVKADGAEQAADQLDDLSASAAMAEGQAAAYARAQAKAAAETKKSVPAVKGLSDITEQLGNKIAVLREAQENGARSAAILAAQLKAGANASSEEISRIGELTGKLYDLSNGQEKINTSTKAANDGLGRFRNTAGQVGYQVQDMVVQLQGGTSAFVAIGQQGSQLAGAFGPGGAVLGAVIALASAVGGVLYKAFTDTGASAKDLEKGANELAKSFQTTKTGTIEFSDALIQLSQNGDAAYSSMVKLIGLQASQQVDRSTTAIKEQAKELLGNSVAAQTSISTLDELISRNVDVASTLDNINVVTDAGSAKYGNLAASVREVADTYGIGTKEVTDMLVAQRQFNAEPTAENAQKIADATTRAAAAATENKKEILDQAEAAQKNALALEQARKQQDLVTESQKRMGAATNSTTKKINEQNDAIVRSAQIAILGERERVKAMADADKEAFAKREGVTTEQIAAYNAAKDKEAQQDIARIDKTEKDKNDRINKAADNRAESQAKRDASAAAAQKKAAETFLATIDRQSGDQIARINTTEQQKLDKLAEFQQQGAISAQQFEDTKTQIQLDAEAARQEELTKRKEEQAKKEGKHDQFIADMEAINATELELIDVQQKAKEDKAREFYDRGIINEEEYQASLAAIAKGADKKRVKSYSDMLGQTTDDLKTALGEGNAMYKAFAIANAIMQTYVAANAAYQSAAAIPIVGWVAGPIAAAAAVAAGLANVGKIRSAREQGGNLSVGQASTIAERNKAEVIVPASASRVRTAQQMRQIMGENNSSSSGNNGVVIVNNTTGRIDSATTEKDDEGRLRVIIDEHVSSAMQDSNSNISKSRRATRGLPGF